MVVVKISLQVMLFLTLALTSEFAWSQKQKVQKDFGITTQPITEEEQILRNLIQVADRIVEIRKTLVELDKSQKGVPSKEVIGRKTRLQKELSELVANFESMSTRVPEEELPQTNEVKLNWGDAITEITRPLLVAIQEISDKPRKIDLLNAKIQTLNNQLERFKVAEDHLNALSDVERLTDSDGKRVHRDVVKVFSSEVEVLKQKYNPELIQLKLEETQRSLDEIQNSKESIFEALAKTVIEFFRVRGRNLLFSFGLFLFVWGFLKFLFRLITERTPIFNRVRSSDRKVISAFSNIFFLSVASIAGLLTLYLQNDWLLLSLLLLGLFGVAWASRQVIPKFISEIRLIMNLGALREKERVIYEGVPFHIKEIGFYVTLENPSLAGGSLHLPVGELLEKHSRPVVDNEKWFPTEMGDWVFLSDGTYGKINMQTLEHVEVDYYEGMKYYSTTNFLELNPINLSGGYSHLIQFGLDYSEQEKVVREWPEKFEAYISQKMTESQETTGFSNVVVEFHNAAESSLVLLVKTAFKPGYGDQYFYNYRLLNRLLVEACNLHKLVIPFNQLTLSVGPQLESHVNRITQ